MTVHLECLHFKAAADEPVGHDRDKFARLNIYMLGIRKAHIKTALRWADTSHLELKFVSL